MSQVTTDISDLGSIISNFFDGKATIQQTNAAFGNLGTLIGQQVKADETTVVNVLPPAVIQDITTGFPLLSQAAQAGISLLGENIQPYLAGGAKAIEGAVDNVVSAAVGPVIGTGLNLLVNGGFDTIEKALAASLSAQIAAWKAKLASQTGSPVTPAAG